MSSKTCTKCGQHKPLTEYFTDKRLKTGRVAECKQCYKSRIAVTRTPEYKKQVQARWISSDKGRQYQEKVRHQRKVQQTKVKYERIARLQQITETATLTWRKTHAKRNLTKIHATPKWVDANHKQRVIEIYAATQQLQELTAAIYHVDHIVPLVSDNVCGLHVWWNLQPLIESANVSKSNQFFPELYPEQDRVAFPSGDGPNVTGVVTQTENMEQDDE
jgi:hypothetical protein